MKTTLIFLFGLLTLEVVAQNIQRYDLYVRDTLIDRTGKTTRAIAINGELAAPTLHFIEGDTAEIYVHNQMHMETSIHWHGLLLPNEQDGVPYLTTAPIKGMSTHVYRFPIKQNGTYWYHSHTMLQEQIGMYGAFIIHKNEKETYPEEVLLLSDWTDENPHQIERSLHFATDWYMMKKNAVQSYGEALVKGKLGVKIGNEWKRMHAMDVSDVFYDQFLMNGYQNAGEREYKKGDTVRLRIINGSSSTYFWLNYAGGKMMVVASDGQDVVPVPVDRFIIGVSEIYDVLVVIPEDGKSFEVSATSEDRIGHSSVWLGKGDKVAAPIFGRLDYFAGMKMMNDMMTIGGNMMDMGMNMSLQQMDMNRVMYPELNEQEEPIVTLNYAMLKAPQPTTLPDAPTTTYHFELTGNMNRYVWTLDNKTISESDRILIKGGENVRIILTNNSMMRHPMHLHGHFFRILNGQGDYSPLKNVLDIMPMETDTIEFNASEGYGDWYFHCHILYHMMAGMGRIFRYEDTPPNPQIMDPKMALKMVYHDDKRFYFGAEVGLESNGSDAEFTLMNTRWKHEVEWRLGWNDQSGYETESHFGRLIGRNQFLYAYAGWDWRYRAGHDGERNMFNQLSTKNDRGVAHFGFQYTLPMLLTVDASIDHTGYVRFALRREDFPLTNRIRLWGSVNTDLEYNFGVRYVLTKYWSISTHYDSDMGYGAGLLLTY